MKWTTSPLNSVAEIVRGVSFSAQETSNTEKNNTIGVLRAGNIQEKLIVNSDLLYIPSSKVKEQQLIRSGDIAMCTSSGSPKIVGKVAYAESDTNRTVGAFCCIIRPQKELVSSKYLFHFFNSSIFKNWAELSPGVNIKNIKISALHNFVVPLPPLTEQRRIADILDKADAIRRKRQQSLKLADDLVKSQFIEMFGDPVTNPMGWEIRPFSAFADIDAIMTTDYKKYADYPHIGIDSIASGTGELRGFRTVEQDGVKSGKYIFTPDHIIYSKIRPNLNKVALPVFDGLCSADAYPIRAKGNCNKLFLAHMMRSELFLMYILPLSQRTNFPKANREQIMGFFMPLPPIALQNEFARFVKQADKSKSAMQNQLSEIEMLSSALKQEFFS